MVRRDCLCVGMTCALNGVLRRTSSHFRFHSGIPAKLSTCRRIQTCETARKPPKQKLEIMVRAAMLFAFVAGVQLASAFVVCSPARPAPPAVRRHGVAVAGLFDIFKESDESKAAKEAEWQAIQEKARLRRDPEAFAKYEAEVAARRLKEMEAMEQEKAALQSKNDVVVGFAEKGSAGAQVEAGGPFSNENLGGCLAALSRCVLAHIPQLLPPLPAGRCVGPTRRLELGR